MFKKSFFILVLFLKALVLLAQHQSPLKQFCKVSCAEKKWILCHPFIAKTSWKITRLAIETSDSLNNIKALDSDPNGGQIDAFRHAFWMALLTLEIGEKNALKLGKAHEKGNYRNFKKHRLEDSALPDKASGEMDLWNNKIGAGIAASQIKISISDLRDTIIKYIEGGKMKIIVKNCQKKALDGEGNPLPLDQINKWDNGKCLVKSDSICK